MYCRQIFLDTETTGLDPLHHRLTEIGCLEVIDRKVTGRHFQTYLNPERDPDEATVKITGLTRDFLKDKPKFSEVVEDFLNFLLIEGTELIIHNAPFDLGFLNRELFLLAHARHPLEESFKVLDTLVLARQRHPGQRNNLDALCRRYQIDLSKRQHHGALLDANLLMQVYLAMTAGQSQMALHPVHPVHPANSDRSFLDNNKISLVDKQSQPEAGLLRQSLKENPPVTVFPETSEAPLRVIRANDAELKAHLVRMAPLLLKKDKMIK